MGLLNNLFKKDKKQNQDSSISKSKNELTELDELKIKQSEQFKKMQNEDYYFSEESKTNAHEINKEKDEYLKNNPEDFVTRGVNLYNMLWEYSDRVPPEEVKIFELTGKGLYYEDQEEYEKAIEYYQEADDLTMDFLKDEIEELIKENGEGDYLYTAKLRQRIEVCEHRIFRKIYKIMEVQAKELEKTDIQGAINKYKLLNILNPGLKKYDKRIEILERKLE